MPEVTLKMKPFSVFLAVLACLLYPEDSQCLSPTRLCVIENRVANQSVTLAFRATTQTKPVVVEVSYRSTLSSAAEWSPWINLGAPIASLPISNPACDYTDRNQTQVFLQASDGQVYFITQDLQSALKFSSWTRVGSNRLPSDPFSGTLVDPVSVAWYGKILMVFARSMSSNASHLYWCKGNATGFGSWGLLSGSMILGTDATFIKNPFTGKYEGFVLSTGGKIHRTWQHGESSFAGWKVMDHGPTCITATRPTAQVMGYNAFNGKLIVAVIGIDDYVYQVEQTTCDKVDNPWSYCTWGSWYKGAGKIPFVPGGVNNNLIMSRNVHFGVEIFTVEDVGQVWQAWQLDRGASWHGFSKVPQDLKTASLASLPYFRINDGGWWEAYALNATNQIVMVQPARSLNVTPSRVPFGGSLTVSWSMPVDEATSSDWIGIYPDGAQNHQYVDFRYVQGGLNPGREPVYVGNTTLASYLPDGIYNVRYLVNRKYVSTANTSVSYFNMSHESDTLQLFRGLFEGLEVSDQGMEQCVDEEALTIETLLECFRAFEEMEIFEGLHLLGKAMLDLAETLRVCEETALAKNLEDFIEDLLSCIDGDCIGFAIDILEEIVIIYEERYEIYGDIQAASNNFNVIEAYQQGGLCIGRMVDACLGWMP